MSVQNLWPGPDTEVVNLAASTTERTTRADLLHTTAWLSTDSGRLSTTPSGIGIAGTPYRSPSAASRRLRPAPYSRSSSRILIS